MGLTLYFITPGVSLKKGDKESHRHLSKRTTWDSSQAAEDLLPPGLGIVVFARLQRYIALSPLINPLLTEHNSYSMLKNPER